MNPDAAQPLHQDPNATQPLHQDPHAAQPLNLDPDAHLYKERFPDIWDSSLEKALILLNSTKIWLEHSHCIRIIMHG